MGNSLNPYGKPVITPTPTETVADIQAVADFADVFANVRVGTASARNGLGPGQMRPGMVFNEIDTGITYWWTGVEWRYVSGVIGVARENASQSVPNDQNTTPTFSPPVVARGMTLASNGFTVGTAGEYRISAGCLFTANGTGYRTMSLLINGSPVSLFDRTAHLGASNTVPLQISGPQSLSAGDTVTMRLVQTSGGALNISTRYLSLERMT